MLKVILLLALFGTITFVNCYLEESRFPQDRHDPLQLLSNPTKGNGKRENNINDILLRYFKGKSISDYVEVQLIHSDDILNMLAFDKNRPTVFYIHGYRETMNAPSVKTVINAYLSHQPNTNVIAIDWSNMADGLYTLNAAPNTKKVGLAVAMELKKLLDKGLNFNDLHIVGHSLGGQISGFIGKEMQKLGTKLKRISALDPAFPLFYPGLLTEHISSNDAEFVDIIHTDAGAFGAPVPTGTVDFWPNAGIRFQPGCPVDLNVEDYCSHAKSWMYWSESLANPHAFPSLKTKNFFEYLELIKYDVRGPIVYMGINADRSASGNYFLKTNAEPPYGKGILA